MLASVSTINPFPQNMFAAIGTLGFAVMAAAQSTGFTQSYCSSQNTGSGDAFFWTYQTNGKCTDHCNALGTWAFAVIQYTDCWCSNYIPSTTTDITDCQKDCPGYPSEKCGDKDAGLYIYIEMDGQPSGTAGGSQSSSVSASSATPAPSSADAPSSSDAATPSSDKQASSSFKTSVSSSTLAPSISVQVITESGAVVTRTVIFHPTEASSQQTSSTSSSSSNTGAIVGGVVGGVVAITAIVGGILFFLWRRRKQHRAEQEHQAGITRNTSTMSKSGLLGGRSVATDPYYPPPIATNVSNAGSRHDNESISPTSASQRRYSQPMMIDSRLNPETVLMYHPTFANSRESLGSIDDSRDYGRQLNIRNPDPR